MQPLGQIFKDLKMYWQKLNIIFLIMVSLEYNHLKLNYGVFATLEWAFMSTDEQVCHVNSIMLVYLKKNQGNPLTQNHSEK